DGAVACAPAAAQPYLVELGEGVGSAAGAEGGQRGDEAPHVGGAQVLPESREVGVDLVEIEASRVAVVLVRGERDAAGLPADLGDQLGDELAQGVRLPGLGV